MLRIALFLCCSFSVLQAYTLPAHSSQILIVSTLSPQDNHGFLQAYEKTADQKLLKVFSKIPVMLGRNGLSTHKKEGDGKSPAGLFSLPLVFGYAKHSPNPHMPYLHATKELHCVDDSKSKFYNQLIKANTSYDSHEVMQREDLLYEYGILVAYNSEQIPYKGSCIFIHVMHPDKTPTSGCTSMAKEDLLKIIRWLDISKNPLLLQNIKDEK